MARALELDRTERRQFTTYLIDQLADGNIEATFEGCYYSLVAKFGERYGFDTGDLDSELEGLILGAMAERLDHLYDMEDPSNDDIAQTCDLEFALNRQPRGANRRMSNDV